MKTRVLFLVAAALLPVSCQRLGPPSPSKDDLPLLVGKWSIERAECDGENWSNPYRLAKLEITAGGKYTFALPGVAEETGTITVAPAKSPKEMDWRADNGLAKNRVQSAIYKLDGDNLTICLSMIEDRRPTEFETSADSWRVFLTCKRKKLPDKQKGEMVVAPSSAGSPSLPREVQQPWVRAGAEVGWLRIRSDIVTLDFQRKPEGLVDAVPAFRFKVWNEGTLSKLPAPKTPFGLDLIGTEATDADLKELASLEFLHTLNLPFTKLTDDGLNNLSGLKSLHVLNLYATKVTDVGLKELASLKSLHTLDLRALHVTDVGLKDLAGLKTLKSLDLGGTKITDVGLKELAGLRSLQHLDLTSTRVTEAGVKELKQALPNCQIVH